MKLTKREKVLLGLLCSVGLIFSYYNFIFSPQYNKYSKLKTTIDSNRSTIDEIKTEISQGGKLEKEIKILKTKIGKDSEDLFPEIRQERLIVLIDYLLTTSGLKGEGITFEEEVVSPVQIPKIETKPKEFNLKKLRDTYEGSIKGTIQNQSSQIEDPFKENERTVQEMQGNASKDEDANIQKKGTYLMKATVKWNGDYEQICKFVELIDKNKRNIVIEGISFGTEKKDIYQKSPSKNEKIASVHGEKNMGEIRLAFYGVPKILNQDQDYFDWEFKNAYGKANPFKAFSSYTSSKATLEDGSEQTTLGDFAMTVKPTSSDLPTVMLGRYGDSGNSTYVYGDSEGFLNAKFQLSQKGTRYFVTYTVGGDMYPITEYVPKSSNVSLDIMSSTRNGEKDKSGVNLTLENKTDLSLDVNLIGDDIKNPRIKISSKTGNIKINK